MLLVELLNPFTAPSSGRSIFARVVAILSSLALLQALFFVVLPLRTKHIEHRLDKAADAYTEYYSTRLSDSYKMLPPRLGVVYRIYTRTRNADPGGTAFRKLAEATPDERDKLLQQLMASSEGHDTILALLDACYGGNAAQLQIEEYVVTKLSSGAFANADIDSVFLSIKENYFDVATSSANKGFIADARRLYARFIALAYPLSLSNSVFSRQLLDRDLSRARIRLQLLKAMDGYRSSALSDVYSVDSERVERHLNDAEPNVSAYATFAGASLRFHGGEQEKALAILDSHAAACNAIQPECGFLKLKIAHANDQVPADMPRKMAELKTYALALPAGHYLCDDVLYAAVMAGAEIGARSQMKDLVATGQSHCPGGDTLKPMQALAESGGQHGGN